MTLLRSLRSIVLGETWTLPVGVGVILLAGFLLRGVDEALWRDLGGAVLLAGVLAVLAIAAPRPSGHGHVRVVVLVVVLATVVAAIFAWSRYGPRTAPPASPVANQAFPSAADPQAPARVWAVGDGAVDTAAARDVARGIAADRPDRVLYLGDVYERGTAADFEANFDAAYGRLADITLPTPGNHDWPAHRDGYDPFWQRSTGERTPPWYTLRIGGWRIISLNSETDHGADSVQLRRLRGQLDRDDGTCTLAFWHRPRTSAGRHGDQADVAPLWDALRGHASLVLSGHDHDLQRFAPAAGLTQLVVGAGGRSHYGLADDPRLVFGDDQTNGALRLLLRPGSARLTFVSAAGTVLDDSTVSCRPGVVTANTSDPGAPSTRAVP